MIGHEMAEFDRYSPNEFPSGSETASVSFGGGNGEMTSVRIRRSRRKRNAVATASHCANSGNKECIEQEHSAADSPNKNSPFPSPGNGRTPLAHIYSGSGKSSDDGARATDLVIDLGTDLGKFRRVGGTPTPVSSHPGLSRQRLFRALGKRMVKKLTYGVKLTLSTFLITELRKLVDEFVEKQLEICEKHDAQIAKLTGSGTPIGSGQSVENTSPQNAKSISLEAFITYLFMKATLSGSEVDLQVAQELRQAKDAVVARLGGKGAAVIRAQLGVALSEHPEHEIPSSALAFAMKGKNSEDYERYDFASASTEARFLSRVSHALGFSGWDNANAGYGYNATANYGSPASGAVDYAYALSFQENSRLQGVAGNSTNGVNAGNTMKSASTSIPGKNDSGNPNRQMEMYLDSLVADAVQRVKEQMTSKGIHATGSYTASTPSGISPAFDKTSNAMQSRTNAGWNSSCVNPDASYFASFPASFYRRGGRYDYDL